MVVRDDQIIPPQGRTEIRAGDHVIVVLRPGSRPLVDQVFGGHEEGFGELPMSIEFPLRGSTTIGEMQEFYGLQLDVPADTTLDEVLRRRVDRNRPATNQAMRFGPLVLRIRSINSDGEIERVGMTILPENEIANYERKVNLDGAPTDKPPSADALPANPIVAPPKVS
jgi:cell volume regulation protein A